MTTLEAIPAIIGLDRWTPQFTFAAGGGAWTAERPVTNLGSMPLYRVGRTASGSVADTVFIATSPTPLPVRLMAFIGHNADDDDTFTVELFADAGMTRLAHQTATEEFWPVVYDRRSLPIEHESFWTGKLSARQRQRKRHPIRPVWLETPVMAQAIRVTVRKVAPAAGPFQLRLFEIALGHQVSVSPSAGLSYGFRFRTTAVEAECGHKEFLRLPKPPTWKGVIPYLPRDEAMQRMYDGLEDYDLDEPFLFFPFPRETVHWLRTVHFVRNLDPGSYARVTVNRDEVPFSFEGVL